jgi:hypothetical protein
MLNNVFDLCRSDPARSFSIDNYFIKQMRILLLLRRGINQTRVCCRVLRLVLAHRFKIARVGDDFAEFLELIELAQSRFVLL